MAQSHHRLRRSIGLTGGALLAGALVAGGLLVPAQANAAPGSARVAFPNSVPSFVSPRADQGPADTDTTVEGEMYLNLRNETAAEQLATAVSTPGSREYGRYLSPRQWINEFAPTQATFQAAKQFLVNSGMTIWATPASREYIVFRGPAPATAAAFGTTLHRYSVDGTEVTAPASAPTLPSSIAGSVLGVELGSARLELTRPADLPLGASTSGTAPSAKPATTSPDAPCSSYFGQHTGSLPAAYGRTVFPTFVCGYLPGQLRSAGNVAANQNETHQGAGQTVAIIDAYADPTIVQDTNEYMADTGSPQLGRGQYQQIVPSPSQFVDEAACQEPSGWQSEQSIDVQSAHSVAPGAKILYVGGFNCGGGLDIAMSTILDNGLATIVSNSYGNEGEAIPADVVQGEVDLQLQAAGEGIGEYFSSGDSGDESVNLGTTSPDFPASSPFVTAVGGTAEAIDARGHYEFEVGWGNLLDQVTDDAYTSTLPGDLFGGGSGGGVSALFAQPAYQRGVVPNSLARSLGGSPERVVPDIADLADPYTGFEIGISPITDDDTLQTGDFVNQTWGGTSLASPIAAAKMALIQAASHRVIGFANPALYLAHSTDPAAFHDIVAPRQPVALYYHSATSGNIYLNTLDQGLSLSTTRGYDDMTGVGTLNEPNTAAFFGRLRSH